MLALCLLVPQRAAPSGAINDRRRWISPGGSQPWGERGPTQSTPAVKVQCSVAKQRVVWHNKRKTTRWPRSLTKCVGRVRFVKGPEIREPLQRCVPSRFLMINRAYRRCATGELPLTCRAAEDSTSGMFLLFFKRGDNDGEKLKTLYGKSCHAAFREIENKPFLGKRWHIGVCQYTLLSQGVLFVFPRRQKKWKKVFGHP